MSYGYLEFLNFLLRQGNVPRDEKGPWGVTIESIRFGHECGTELSASAHRWTSVRRFIDTVILTITTIDSTPLRRWNGISSAGLQNRGGIRDSLLPASNCLRAVSTLLRISMIDR